MAFTFANEAHMTQLFCDICSTLSKQMSKVCVHSS